VIFFLILYNLYKKHIRQFSHINHIDLFTDFITSFVIFILKMYTQKLPLPEKGYIRHICHISDIHIRSGTESKESKFSRFTEYLNVFKRICSFLEEKYEKGDYEKDLVIIITGDIVHDNKKAGAPCIELFYEIMLRLSNLAPIYIIRGNHDYNQSSIETQDMITSLMIGLRSINNIAYLSQTGFYRANNVCFGVVAIQDTLYAGNTCGKTDHLPPFPSVSQMREYFGDGNNIETTIALFHGDVPFSYPIEWFDNDAYDYIMLGDLHGQQIENAHFLSHTGEDYKDVFLQSSWSIEKKEKTIWGYAGSTLQQNFGEPVIGHGMIMWDIKSKRANMYHIKNDYGYVTVCLKKNNKNNENDDLAVMVNVTRPTKQYMESSWFKLEEIKNMKEFPKIWRVRIKKNRNHKILDSQRVLDAIINAGYQIELSQEMLSVEDNLTKSSIQEIERSFCSLLNGLNSNDKCESTSEQYQKNDGEILNNKLKNVDLQYFNRPESWCIYLKDIIDKKKGNTIHDYKIWSKWFDEPTNLLIKIPTNIQESVNMNVFQDVNERNKKIKDALADYQKIQDEITSVKTSHSQFSLKYMNWSYILCFSENCYFDFMSLDNNVHCIGGKNGYGKTSFLEAICIGLFGEGFPSRSNKQYSSSLICQQIPSKSKAYTSIVFDLDNKTYRLIRNFEKLYSDHNKLQSKDIVLEVFDKYTNQFKEFHSGKKATQEWMTLHVGTLESFLTSCMISQSSEEDFFNKKIVDQKNYLDHQLRLHSSTSFLNFLKTSLLSYNDISKRIKDIIEVHYKDGYLVFDQSKLDCILQKLEEKSKHEINLKQRYEELSNLLSHCNASHFIKGIDLYKTELDEKNKEFIDLEENVKPFLKQIFPDKNDIEVNQSITKYLSEKLGQNKSQISLNIEDYNLICLLESSQDEKEKHLMILNQERDQIKKEKEELENKLRDIDNISVQEKDNFEKQLYILENEYNKCKIGLDNMEKSCESYDKLKTDLNELDTEIESYKIKKNASLSLVEDFQKRKDKTQDELSEIIFKQPQEIPIYNEEQYNEWYEKMEKIKMNEHTIQELESSYKKMLENEPSDSFMNLSEIERHESRLLIWWKNTLDFLMKIQDLGRENIPLKNFEKVWHFCNQYIELNIEEKEKILNEKNKEKEDLINHLETIQRSYDELSNEYHSFYEKNPIPQAPNKINSQKDYDSIYDEFSTKYETYRVLKEKNKTKPAVNKDIFSNKPSEEIVDYWQDLEYKFNDAYMLYKNMINIEEKVDDTKRLIEDCEDHNFNPNCSACCNHPWKRKKEKMLRDLNILENEKTELSNKIFMDILPTLFKKYDINFDWKTKIVIEKQDIFEEKVKEISEIKNYEISKKYIMDTRVLLKQYDAYKVQKENWNNKKQSLKESMENIQINIKETKELIQKNEQDSIMINKGLNENREKLVILIQKKSEWDNDISNLFNDILENKQKILEREKWELSFKELENKLNDWNHVKNQKDEQINSYNIRLSNKSWQESCVQIKETLKNIQNQIVFHETHAKEWEEKIKIICLKRNTLKEQIDIQDKIIKDIDHIKKHVNDLEKNKISLNDKLLSINDWCIKEQKLKEKNIMLEIFCLENIVIMIEKRQNILNEIKILEDTIKSIFENSPYWEEKNKLSDEISSISIDIHDLKRDKQDLDTLKKDVENKKEMFDRMMTFYEHLISNIKTLTIILQEFGRFKDWVLEKKIIPIILEHLNHLLSLMCRNHRPISLDCHFIQDINTSQQQNKSFYWIIKDGPLSPPLEKASGFQKCVINLAMRIVLGRLGVSGIKNTQLFIDEGFTSCDMENLENIPFVLQELLNIYKSIVIVSHLEELKNCIASSISIDRNFIDHLSKIQYGKKNDIFNFEKKYAEKKTSQPFMKKVIKNKF